MDNKSILRSNFLIMFEELNKAVDSYIKHGHTKGELQYVDAYLSATIHTLMDYADKYLDKDSDLVMACRYACNTLKHNSALITHREIRGGISFPISFPLCFEEIKVVWNYDKTVKTRHPDQQAAFEKIFAGKQILETLKPIAELIEKDG